ncbi:hypothetical protein [Taklimakanibacter deserti]|uniref:hypothetical protein n=1 Tax=Taklimakanibacter deserti TaxID=2267839 RepID=UPI000E64C05A
MTRLVKLTIFASALALASLGASHFATAQEKTWRKCIDCVPGGNGGGPDVGQDEGYSGKRKQYELPDGQNGPDQGTSMKRKWKPQPDNQAEIGDDGPDQGTSMKRKWKPPQGDQYQKGGDDDVVIDKKRVRQADRSKWKYNPDRHERRRHKDKKYRFYFGGFWYPQPYWDEPYYYIDPYRVSCREGAEIVSERFARVRIVECDGRVFTYLGRRYGDTFEIKLSSRTGRILDAREI